MHISGVILKLLPFAAFLRRHIASIPHDNLLLVFDLPTKDEAGGIASALHPVTSITCVNYPYLNASLLAPFNRFVFISLLSQKDTLDVILKLKLTVSSIHQTKKKLTGTFMVVCWAHDKFSQQLHAQLRHRNGFYVLVQTGRLLFGAWNILSLAEYLQKPLSVPWMSESQFIGSYHWTIIRDRLTRIPPGIRVGFGVNAENTGLFRMLLVQFGGHIVLTGVRVGLCKIVAEQMGARFNSTFEIIFEEDIFTDKGALIDSVPSVDWRQTANYGIPRRHGIVETYSFGLGLLPTDDWVDASDVNRFDVLAPLETVHDYTKQMSEMTQRILMVIALIAVGTGFTIVRWFYKQSPSHSRPIKSVPNLWFDTFCRLLGISGGSWSGHSSERLILVVISVFTILMGSIFSGLLYERLLVEVEVQQRYNTLQDLCEDDVLIRVQLELVLAAHQTLKPQCKLNIIRSTHYTSTQAYIMDEYQARDTVEWFGFHHILPKPFGILSTFVHTSHSFLKFPIQRILRRCTETGLRMAFMRSSNHTLMLAAARLRANEDNSELAQNVSDGTDDFEFVLVAFGWTVAGLVFIVELLMDGIKRRFQRFMELRSLMKVLQGKL